MMLIKQKTPADTQLPPSPPLLHVYRRTKRTKEMRSREVEARQGFSASGQEVTLGHPCNEVSTVPQCSTSVRRGERAFPRPGSWPSPSDMPCAEPVVGEAVPEPQTGHCYHYTASRKLAAPKPTKRSNPCPSQVTSGDQTSASSKSSSASESLSEVSMAAAQEAL